MLCTFNTISHIIRFRRKSVDVPRRDRAVLVVPVLLPPHRPQPRRAHPHLAVVDAAHRTETITEAVRTSHSSHTLPHTSTRIRTCVPFRRPCIPEHRCNYHSTVICSTPSCPCRTRQFTTRDGSLRGTAEGVGFRQFSSHVVMTDDGNEGTASQGIETTAEVADRLFVTNAIERTPIR